MKSEILMNLLLNDKVFRCFRFTREKLLHTNVLVCYLAIVAYLAIFFGPVRQAVSITWG